MIRWARLMALPALLACPGAAAAAELHGPSGGPGGSGDAISIAQQALGATGARVDLLDLVRADAAIRDTDPMVRVRGLVERFDRRATLVDGLDEGRLAAIAHPVILRVKGTLNAPDFDRFVIYTGLQDGLATVRNYPNPDKQLPLSLLLARSDRRGVVVSPAAFVPPRPRTPAWVVATGIAAAAAAAGIARQRTAAAGRAPGRRVPLARAAAQAASLLVASAAAAVVAHAARPAGFLAGTGTWPRAYVPDPDRVRFVAADDPAAQPIASISLAEARQRLAAGELFVDAREADQFARGHIKDAINVPDLTAAGRHLSMAGVPRNRPIVVYCASARCPRGRMLVAGLRDDGYANVVLYDEGWEHWTENVR